MASKMIFVGIEAEGRWRGLPTCFISAEAFMLNEVTVHMLIKKGEYPHYYLGAASMLVPADKLDLCSALMRLNTRAVYTLEIPLAAVSDIPTRMLSRDDIRIVARAPHVAGGASLLRNVEVKVQDEDYASLFSFQHSQPLVYLKDEELP